MGGGQESLEKFDRQRLSWTSADTNKFYDWSLVAAQTVRLFNFEDSRGRGITMVTDKREEDNAALWIKEPPVSLSAVSRFRRWVVPGLTAAVLLVLIVVLGASNVKMSNRLWSMEQNVSNLSDVIQSLNASLQLSQAKEVQRLQFAVENTRDQLTSVSEALKQLAMVDSLSRRVAALQCSLQHIVHNSSVGDGCCPLDWIQSGVDCFFFSSLSLSWNESKAWCETHEAHLLILHDDKAWDFVSRRAGPNLFWVGLSDWRTGRWEWVNQTPYMMDRRRWVAGRYGGWFGHGGKNCAHLHAAGRLSSLHCSTKIRYICQKHSAH